MVGLADVAVLMDYSPSLETNSSKQRYAGTWWELQKVPGNPETLHTG